MIQGNTTSNSLNARLLLVPALPSPPFHSPGETWETDRWTKQEGCNNRGPENSRTGKGWDKLQGRNNALGLVRNFAEGCQEYLPKLLTLHKQEGLNGVIALMANT